MAAAVASTSRQVGGTLGVAVIGAVLAAGVAGTGSPRGAAYAAAFVDASKPAWWILSGCGLSVLLVGALTSGRWARKTAHRTAERLEAPTGAAAGDQASASSRV